MEPDDVPLGIEAVCPRTPARVKAEAVAIRALGQTASSPRVDTTRSVVARGIPLLSVQLWTGRASARPLIRCASRVCSDGGDPPRVEASRFDGGPSVHWALSQPV
jgi:hypothetical protein